MIISTWLLRVSKKLPTANRNFLSRRFCSETHKVKRFLRSEGRVAQSLALLLSTTLESREKYSTLQRRLEGGQGLQDMMSQQRREPQD